MTDLDRTLRTLCPPRWCVGRRGDRRARRRGSVAARAVSPLRPLAELGSVAAAVAEGHLDARLQTGNDPDLGPLGASFNQAVAELEHRVEADSRFAVDVSHELRTPLTTMLNSMQVIKNREASLPDSVREPLDLLAEELERFRRLVVDLLEMARHDAGQGLVLEEVNLAELVRAAADQAAGRPVTEPAGPLTMSVDKRRLERVVANLVSNAESHGGGVVAVRLLRRGPLARIEVDDAGPGVDPDHRARIFDRFSRGAGPGDSAGLGLGARHRPAPRGAARWLRHCREPTGRGSQVCRRAADHRGLTGAVAPERAPPSASSRRDSSSRRSCPRAASRRRTPRSLSRGRARRARGRARALPLPRPCRSRCRPTF